MPLADDATTGQNMAIHTKDKDSSEQLKQLCCVFLNKQTEPWATSHYMFNSFLVLTTPPT